jgi:hypothetical protein
MVRPMPSRMDPSALKPEYRTPEMRALMIGVLHVLAGRLRVVADLQRDGWPLTYVDTVVNLQVFAFGHEGTHQQVIIDTLGVPRRTVRDSLKRLEETGLVVREGRLYFPSEVTARFANEMCGEAIAQIGRACDLMNDYREATRRNTP